VTRPKSRINIPDRKISETFLEFAEPLLVPLGPCATEYEMNQVLQIAFVVWNAVVYESVKQDAHCLEMLQDLTASEPEIVLLVDQLIERKRSQYGNDHRIVGDFKLTIRSGELNLRAEARDPTVPAQ